MSEMRVGGLIDEFNYELNSSELNVTYLRQITANRENNGVTTKIILLHSRESY